MKCSQFSPHLPLWQVTEHFHQPLNVSSAPLEIYVERFSIVNTKSVEPESRNM